MSTLAADARQSAVRRGPAIGIATAALLGLLALLLAGDAGVKNADAVPEVARATLALLVLVCVAGYAPARLLLPRGMEPHFPFLVPLVGSATAGLGLTLFGFMAVPWSVSLPLLLVLGAVAGVAIRARHGPAHIAPGQMEQAGGRLLALVWPGFLALLLVLVATVPLFRDGSATVYGTNPDGHLSVGAAQFLQNARPETVDRALPVDRMPLVWRSKYPIYYVLAGASSLSGLTPIEAFASVSALLGVLTALAFLLLARYGLGASPVGALLTMGLVGADRLLAHLSLHPYHNQLWGTLALPLILVFGWRFIERRDRRSGLLAALFAVLGVLAYPLMALFPLLAIAPAALVARPWRQWSGWPRLPASARGRLLAAMAAVAALPAAVILLLGVFEKAQGASKVIVPHSSLAAWRGDLTAFPAVGWFFGAPVRAVGPSTVAGAPSWLGAVVAASVIATGLIGLRRVARPAAAGLAAAALGGLVLALYFRLRTGGEYFYFKLLAFLAPLLIAAAAAAAARAWSAARRPAAVLAGVAATVWISVSLLGLRQEVRNTGPQLTPALLGLRDGARRLPAGASIRLDIPPDGTQLWAGHMLASHPLSSLQPLVGTTYPHVPQGRRADYIVADTRLGRARGPDAEGPALFDNGRFRIYAMKPGVEGPDRSSQAMEEGLGQVLK